MTTAPNDSSKQSAPEQSLEHSLAALAAAERKHTVSASLKQTIAAEVHAAMREATTTNTDSIVDQALEWLSAHWWRMASMGTTAAAVPLLVGALLGYQLTSVDELGHDPASDWISSYTTMDADRTDSALEDAP